LDSCCRERKNDQQHRAMTCNWTPHRGGVLLTQEMFAREKPYPDAYQPPADGLGSGHAQSKALKAAMMALPEPAPLATHG
jgi:hypothetical protein